MGRHSAPTKREIRLAQRESAPAARQGGAGASLLRRAPVRVAAAGAGLLVLGTTVGFMSLGKHVQVVVDGEARTVTTYASDVRGALLDAGISDPSALRITPSPSTAVADGATIEVSAPVSTPAPRVQTVQRQPDLYQPVTVVADGRQQVVHTAAGDVSGALADAGVELGASDQSSPAPSTPVTAGMTIDVTRTSEQTVTEQQSLPHRTVEQSDPDEYVGIDKVLTPGSDGLQETTYQVSITGGVETSRTQVAQTVVTAPVDKVIAKGSKQFPASVDALNWESLGKCESTNNPKAVNKTNGKYFGEYQFSVETWAGVGGTGNPMDAPAEEQLARAKILFMKYGAGQWECGSHLYD